MSNATISIAVIAAVLFGSAACKRNEIESEAEDVREQRKDVQEVKGELQEEKRELQEQEAELSVALQEQLNEAEARFRGLDQQAEAAVAKLDATSGPGAEIQQQRMLAKAKLEAARSAKASNEVEQQLNAAREALDRLEKQLDDYK